MAATTGGDDIIGFDPGIDVSLIAVDTDVTADIVDGFLALSGNLGAEVWRGESSQLSVNAGLASEQFSRYSGLSNYSASAAATYTFSFVPGFGAPWFSVHTSYRVAEFDSKLRSSNFAKLDLTMGKRIDDRTDLRIGVGTQSRDSDSRAFDNDNSFGFVNLDLMVAPKRTLYFSYRLQ